MSIRLVTVGKLKLKMNTINILADSRGEFLQKYIVSPPGYHLKISSFKGATLPRLQVKAKDMLQSRNCVAVIIMGGICSITRKDDLTHQIYLPNKTAGTIYTETTNLILDLLHGLDCLNTGKPVVMATIMGADLTKANGLGRQRRKHLQQDVLDESVTRINRFIRDLNLKRGNETPSIASAIRRCHGNGIYRTTYSRLPDGVHPDTAVLRFWAKRLRENAQYLIDNHLV